MRDSLIYEYNNIPDYGFAIHVPDHVMRTDQTIVAWRDVPEKYQKKIMEGTMTNEDWDADWEPPVAKPEEFRDKVNEITTNQLATETSRWTAGHVHVFRKEYDECMIKGCGVINGQRRE